MLQLLLLLLHQLLHLLLPLLKLLLQLLHQLLLTLLLPRSKLLLINSVDKKSHLRVAFLWLFDYLGNQYLEYIKNVNLKTHIF